MRFIDYIKKRKDIVCLQSEGLNSVITSIKEFKTRLFTLKAVHKKYSGINAETLLKLLQDEIDSMLIVYRYSADIKQFTDRKGCSQMHIKLIGRASMMSKYNPLDIKMVIFTESK